MPRALVLAAVLFASLGVMAATAPADTHDSDTGCNILLKGLKMLSDPQRKLVNLHPKNTTVAAINALPQPHPTPKTRSTGFRRRVWRVPAQITEFKLEGDSDIHLILFDAGSYLIAEMPAGQCIPKKARDRKAMIAVRKKFHDARYALGVPPARDERLPPLTEVALRRVRSNGASMPAARWPMIVTSTEHQLARCPVEGSSSTLPW